MEPHQVDGGFRFCLRHQHIGEGDNPALMTQDGNRLGGDVVRVERPQRKAFHGCRVLSAR